MTRDARGARGRAAVFCLAVGLCAGAARAQGTDAEALIRQGVELRRRGQDQAALDLFRQAFERAPTPRAEAQMALAEQALGRWVDAEAHLRHALESASDPWIRGARATLDASVAMVNQHVGRIEIISSTPGAEIWLEGRRAGALPMTEPLRAVAGTTVVEVRAPGYHPTQRSVVVTAGQLSRESVDLSAIVAVNNGGAAVVAVGGAQGGGAPGGVVVVDRPARRPLPPAVFAVSAGLTVAAAAVLVWSGVDTLDARDAYVRNPTEAGFNDGVGRETRTNALIGVTAGLGALSVALGLFATEWSSAPAPARRAQALPVVPFVAPAGGGVLVGAGQAF